jgi:DnaJ-class molecular chaperone
MKFFPCWACRGTGSIPGPYHPSPCQNCDGKGEVATLDKYDRARRRLNDAFRLDRGRESTPTMPRNGRSEWC